jgi:PAS domain S-box-containing protein
VKKEVGKDQKQSRDSPKLLLDLVHNTSSAPGFREALAAFLEQAGDLVPGDGVAVLWLHGGELEVVASSGDTAPLLGLNLPAIHMGAAQAVLDSRRPVVVEDTARDARWQRVPGEEQARSWLGVPLLADGRLLGLVEWTAAQPARWDEAKAARALEIAHHSAPILYQAQLLHDTRQRLRELVEPVLNRAPQAIDLAAELQPVVREALDFTDARDAFVFLLGERTQWLHCVAASGKRRDRLRKVVLRGDGSLGGLGGVGGWSLPVFRSRDRLGGSLSDREAMATIGIEKTLILPLRVGKEQVGILGVAGPRRGQAFSQDAIRLMTHLASQASLIVEQCYHARSESEHYDYEMVVQGAPLGIGVLTITGNVRACNPALSALLSRADRSVVGSNLSEFLVPRDGRRFTQALEEVAITGQRRQVDVRIGAASGEQRHVRISLALSPISNDAGGTLVAMMEDVTSLKILEQERVGHLRELREKHDQLQELDQLKSRFVSNVSHELRTPLAVIKLYATLARKGRPEKQIYYLQTIEQETHRLETMVENILDLTRMDRQALRVNPEWVDAGEIIGQVVEVYEEAARKQGVKLRNHARDEFPALWADKNHLIQMLTNLMDNALKYTPRDGQVWVAARELEVNSQQVLEIAVGDSGVGIPADEQTKIFDRFYRGSNNTPGSTGTGLGLAIVQELMAMHGGKVTLQSQVGEGSVFALQFPLDAPDSPSRPPGRA